MATGRRRNEGSMKFTALLLATLLVSSMGSSIVACGGKSTDASTAPTAQQIDDLRERWNAAAKTIHASSSNDFDFTWTEAAFPAPTFRGGSPEAYEEYAEILILFYSTGDNLEFAKSSGLLTHPFGDGLASRSGGSTWSLQGMTTSLTSPTPPGFAGYVRPDTVAKLKTFCPTVGCTSPTS
jgi:hypothetical protein